MGEKGVGYGRKGGGRKGNGIKGSERMGVGYGIWEKRGWKKMGGIWEWEKRDGVGEKGVGVGERELLRFRYILI